jgi:hypothetical protein
MTPQESQILQDFLTQLEQAKGVAKDPQAEALIAAAVAKQPDAPYLLVQRALLVEQALNAAKAQIAELQKQQASSAAGGSSFLNSGSTWGRPNADAIRPAAPPSTAPQTAPPSNAPQAAPQAARPSLLGGGGGSFLGTVAATAAGVAGGAFLFQGIENLMGHHGTGSGFLSQSAPEGNTAIDKDYAADSSKDSSDVADDGSDDADIVADDGFDSGGDDSFA